MFGTRRQLSSLIVAAGATFGLLTIACVSVAGSLRPAWAPTWSTLTTNLTPPHSASNVRVLVFFESAQQRLPGMEITAVPLHTEKHEHEPEQRTHEVTDGNGAANLSLAEGEWVIRATLPGIWPVERNIRVASNASYVLKMYTAARRGETITVVQTRLLTQRSDARSLLCVSTLSINAGGVSGVTAHVLDAADHSDDVRERASYADRTREAARCPLPDSEHQDLLQKAKHVCSPGHDSAMTGPAEPLRNSFGQLRLSDRFRLQGA
jgi:hypothetical protein